MSSMTTSAASIWRPRIEPSAGCSKMLGLFPHLTVAKNLRYGLVRARGRPAHINFDDVVSVLDIARLLQRHPRDPFGGEKLSAWRLAGLC